jgi:hypothetical protein
MITEDIDNIYGILNSIILEKLQSERTAGSLYFKSCGQSMLNRKETFDKIYEALDLIEGLKVDIEFLIKKQSNG